MKKSLSKVISLAIISTMILTGCAAVGESTENEQVKADLGSDFTATGAVSSTITEAASDDNKVDENDTEIDEADVLEDETESTTEAVNELGSYDDAMFKYQEIVSSTGFDFWIVDLDDTGIPYLIMPIENTVNIYSYDVVNATISSFPFLDSFTQVELIYDKDNKKVYIDKAASWDTSHTLYEYAVEDGVFSNTNVIPYDIYNYDEFRRKTTKEVEEDLGIPVSTGKMMSSRYVKGEAMDYGIGVGRYHDLSKYDTWNALSAFKDFMKDGNGNGEYINLLGPVNNPYLYVYTYSVEGVLVDYKDGEAVATSLGGNISYNENEEKIIYITGAAETGLHYNMINLTTGITTEVDATAITEEYKPIDYTKNSEFWGSDKYIQYMSKK